MVTLGRSVKSAGTWNVTLRMVFFFPVDSPSSEVRVRPPRDQRFQIQTLDEPHGSPLSEQKVDVSDPSSAQKAGIGWRNRNDDLWLMLVGWEW
jgi:hypothetical protein